MTAAAPSLASRRIPRQKWFSAGSPSDSVTDPAEKGAPMGSSAPRAADRGTISVALMLLLVITLAGAGLIVDGGRTMAARRHASNVAESAARAAVSTMSPVTPLDPATARAAALRVTIAARIPDRDVVIEVHPDVVVVTVTERRAAVFAAFGGRTSFTVRATGRARIQFVP